MVPKLKHERDLLGMDALRGVAILLVIIAHFFGHYIPDIIEKLCAHGGVMLFFLLSGLLIDLTFSRDHDVARFAVKRGLRILPMYCFTVILIAVLNDKWTMADIAGNLIFSAGFPNQMSGVFWTLYVECLFYILAPLTIMSGTVGLIVAPLLVIARFAYGIAFDVPPSAMWFFLVYCFLGTQIGAAWRGTISATIPLAYTVIVCVAASYLSVGVWLGPLSLACVSILYVTLIVNPTIPVLAWIGRISYSWYLLHSVFGYSVGWSIVAYMHIPAAVGLAIGAMVACLASALTYFLIETPGILLGRIICRRLKSA